MQNFYPPMSGEEIFLKCKKCKAMFKGRNPGSGIRRLFSKTVCPQCGSKKVFPDPRVHY